MSTNPLYSDVLDHILQAAQACGIINHEMASNGSGEVRCYAPLIDTFALLKDLDGESVHVEFGVHDLTGRYLSDQEEELPYSVVRDRLKAMLGRRIGQNPTRVLDFPEQRARWALAHSWALVVHQETSRSGMSARLRVVACSPAGEPEDITDGLATAAGVPLSDKGALIRGNGDDRLHLLLSLAAGTMGLSTRDIEIGSLSRVVRV